MVVVQLVFDAMLQYIFVGFFFIYLFYHLNWSVAPVLLIQSIEFIIGRSLSRALANI